MAEKKSNKFTSILITLAITFVLALVAASGIITYLQEKKFDFKLTIQNIFSSKSLIAAALVCGVVLVLLLLQDDKPSTKLKGKDKMENQRFLMDKELDSHFKHCLYSELPTLSHTGVPFRVVKKGNNLKIHFAPDCHTLIVGATGTGKTVSFIEPALQIIPLLKNKPSFFITDAKGELYSHHSKNLVNQGYKLILLDLTEPYNSVQWNPLEHVYTEWQRQLHLEEDILRHQSDPVKNYDFIKVGEVQDDEWYEFAGKAFSSLKDALLEVEVEKSKIRDDCFESLNDIAAAICTIENKSEPSWEQGARDYFLAVLIAMLEDSENEALGMTKERYNFFNAYKIAMNKEEDYEVVKQYFNGRNPLSKTRQLSANITQTNAKTTRDGYMSTLNTKLSMFADNGIAFLTAKNDVDFYNMDEQPTAFFIKIPDERATRYSLASVCIS
ncbi:MAG: type IV secretory system conjugative DNA transfer family protein, partial [Clostridia bacterium]|nr:type IV secretory system conjugative DNA transfer family protein [Clostridia bacterium]